MEKANIMEQFAKEKRDLRIVLVGKTGVGKSAAGNTILGRRTFKSEFCFGPVTSVCKKETTVFGGLNLAVIDTPGLFDAEKSNKKIMEEISRCISLAAPGPHVFLIVLQLSRFSDEEKETVEIIKTMFGKEADKYTMILFTHGDEQKKKNIKLENMLENYQPLKHIISQCAVFQKFEDKYHVFDNEVEDPAQVRGLVAKINRMVEGNVRRFYTNVMFEEAERAIQKEIERLRRKYPNINLEEARRQAERENSFISAALGAAAGAVVGAAAGAATGAQLGAAVGAVGGPAGAAVGGAFGSSMGLLIGGALAVKEKACVTQ